MLTFAKTKVKRKTCRQSYSNANQSLEASLGSSYSYNINRNEYRKSSEEFNTVGSLPTDSSLPDFKKDSLAKTDLGLCPRLDDSFSFDDGVESGVSCRGLNLMSPDLFVSMDLGDSEEDRSKKEVVVFQMLDKLNSREVVDSIIQAD